MRQRFVVQSVNSNGAELSRNTVLLVSSTKFDPLKSGETDIDFDAWMALYQSDPEEFERRRAILIQSVIDSAPRHYQRRLKGLQFQIDMERRRTDSPLKSCLRISSMMWDMFDQMRANLNELRGQSDCEAVTMPHPSEQFKNADILEYLPRQPPNNNK